MDYYHYREENEFPKRPKTPAAGFQGNGREIIRNKVILF